MSLKGKPTTYTPTGYLIRKGDACPGAAVSPAFAPWFDLFEEMKAGLPVDPESLSARDSEALRIIANEVEMIKETAEVESMNG